MDAVARVDVHGHIEELHMMEKDQIKWGGQYLPIKLSPQNEFDL